MSRVSLEQLASGVSAAQGRAEPGDDENRPERSSGLQAVGQLHFRPRAGEHSSLSAAILA